MKEIGKCFNLSCFRLAGLQHTFQELKEDYDLILKSLGTESYLRKIEL